MKIDIIFSLPKTVLKKAKEALPRDTAGGGAREVRHKSLPAMLPVGKHQAGE